MAEPNFWIENAGSIITGGAALLGTLGGGIATNWVQNRTRKAEERKRDREREIEAVTTALGISKRWEILASTIVSNSRRASSQIERLKDLQGEAYEALNVVRFVGSKDSIRGQARRVMETHRGFTTRAQEAADSPQIMRDSHDLREFLIGARRASSDLDSQARKWLLQ